MDSRDISGLSFSYVTSSVLIGRILHWEGYLPWASSDLKLEMGWHDIMCTILRS
jgi:hypothetical protein